MVAAISLRRLKPSPFAWMCRNSCNGLNNAGYHYRCLHMALHELPPALPKMADDEPATLMNWLLQGCVNVLPQKSLATHHCFWEQGLCWAAKVRNGHADSLGFCGYFLMVRDLMNHSREMAFPLGLVVVPLPVLWWRGARHNQRRPNPSRSSVWAFHQPERLDLPDADLDFSQARRHEGSSIWMNATAKITLRVFRTSLPGRSLCTTWYRSYLWCGVRDMAVSKELKNVEDDSLPLEGCANNWQVSTNTQQNILMHSCSLQVTKPYAWLW